MKKRKSLLVGGITATVFVALLIFGITQASAIKNQLNDWKLLPRPEKLTELYFTYPNNLPSTYVSNQKQVISFTIHNLEYQKMNYRYQIIESNQSGTKSITLKSDNYSLQQNGYVGLSIGESIQDLGSRVKVSVTLSPVNETISYWVVRSN